MNFDLAKSLAILERTPGVLRSLLADLSADWTQGNEGPETWSPFDVVGHLIDAEETDWMPRARVILAQGSDRKFPPFDRYRHLRENKGMRLDTLLDRFAELRARNLTELAALAPGPRELGLTGEHPEFGSVTLAQLLATWVAHDLGHIAQATRVMAKQYREAVGPWRAYLPVMDR
ncbi:MAG TPA: DinB family protein [Thermoanaerobaculia bacterium]